MEGAFYHSSLGGSNELTDRVTNWKLDLLTMFLLLSSYMKLE